MLLSLLCSVANDSLENDSNRDQSSKCAAALAPPHLTSKLFLAFSQRHTQTVTTTLPICINEFFVRKDTCDAGKEKIPFDEMFEKCFYARIKTSHFRRFSFHRGITYLEACTKVH